MTISNRITGVIRLTTPLHCASSDKPTSKPGEANTHTPTCTRRIVTPHGHEEIPYFPGNDFRGRLRRKAATTVLDRIAAGKKVKLDLYAGLVNGTIGVMQKGEVLTVEEMLRASDNVYMGLFGGGPRVLKSRYRVSDLVPIIGTMIDIGTVPAIYRDVTDTLVMPMRYKAAGGDPEPMSGRELIETTTVYQRDDVFSVARPDEMTRFVEDAQAQIAAYQEASSDNASQRKADKAKAKAGEIKADEVAGKKNLQNILSFDSIRAGTPMYFDLDFKDDVSDAHVGLMLLALRDLVREQELGGWVRAGLGKFTAHLTLTRNGAQHQLFEEEWAGANATLSEATAPFEAKACEALDTVTLDGMLEFFLPRGKTKPTKETEAA
jgi:CRISPR type IV-associated protein Csf2